ncbi:hypothetical protein EVAR_1035_1 [Eumeta japonica]|uniref:Uncharacterized protein n=1 Tax=Eumeta variegata TaxID=151549 RepID=A0A4C1SGM6_EUMVA|nr:hypothetical protein EVAR_1035_1 [Eumeta japonica]
MGDVSYNLKVNIRSGDPLPPLSSHSLFINPSSSRYLTREAGSTLITPLRLRVSMGGDPVSFDLNPTHITTPPLSFVELSNGPRPLQESNPRPAASMRAVRGHGPRPAVDPAAALSIVCMGNGEKGFLAPFI